MFIVILAWAAYLYFFYSVVTHKIQIGDFTTSIIVLAVLFLILFIWLVRRFMHIGNKQHTRARSKNQRPAARPAAGNDSGSISFHVAGTTFENDDGSSRQDILRHLKFGDAPWANGPDDLDTTIEETSYNGEQAFAVLVNNYQIGFVPKGDIKKVARALNNVATCYVSETEIVGGGRGQDGKPLSYGCIVTLEY